MFDQLMEYYIEKIFLKKVGPRPTVVYELVERQSESFASYLFIISQYSPLKYAIFLKRILFANSLYYIFYLKRKLYGSINLKLE